VARWINWQNLHKVAPEHVPLGVARRAGEKLVVRIEHRTVFLGPKECEVWELLDGTRSAYEIAAKMAIKYRVPLEDALQIVTTFLYGLQARGLAWDIDELSAPVSTSPQKNPS
jgi:hypothetical protein